jgi:hypothetical protein
VPQLVVSAATRSSRPPCLHHRSEPGTLRSREIGTSGSEGAREGQPPRSTRPWTNAQVRLKSCRQRLRRCSISPLPLDNFENSSMFSTHQTQISVNKAVGGHFDNREAKKYRRFHQRRSELTANPHFSPEFCCAAGSCRAGGRARVSEPATYRQVRLGSSTLRSPTIIGISGRSRRTPVRNAG